MSFKFLRSDIKKTNYFFSVSPRIQAYEPLRSNRFLINLPTELNIPNYLVFGVSMLRYDSEINRWGDIIITLRETTSHQLRSNLIHLINNTNLSNQLLSYEYQLLDTIGATASIYHIIGRISEINFSETSYDSDDLSSVSLTITPEYVQ